MKNPLPLFRLYGAGLTGILLATVAMTHAVQKTEPAKYGGATPLEWSRRMADSQMARQPARPTWDYTTGLLALAMLKLGDETGNTTYSTYAEKVIADCVKADGSITGYRSADYNLDMVAPGKVILAFYERSKEPRYLTALKALRQQLATQPRTASGGFWHKQVYPNQMWLDGLFMAGPFYAQYGKVFNEPADMDDVAKQILLVGEHTYDAKAGLYYHGWDESKTQFWANKETGLSPNFWGRAMGWYAMAVVDSLDSMPENHPQRGAVLALLGRVADGITRWQDPKTGLWWQVLDQGGREGNYLEATAACQFVDALAKAINRGYLPGEKYRGVVEKGYAGIIRDLITTDADGRVNLNQCCAVAGLGGNPSNGRPRDGSFEYYVSERVIANDLKGVGPFILAGMEMEKLAAGAPGGGGASGPGPATGNTTTAGNTTATVSGWARVPAILARIKAPVFPAKDFPITNYGAVAGGEQDATEAIKQAIAACNQAGGGRVVVPDGVFLTGAIHLLSNVNLHLADNATLKFSTDFEKYLPVVFTRYESTECMNYSPFIYAYKQENIAITGKGVLDGSAGPNQWWNWTRLMAADVRQVVALGTKESATPPEQRIFGAGHYLRPNFIQPNNCKNVLIEGVTIRNSPMWEIAPVLCQNVIVRGVKVECPLGPNNDGCDPESCTDVLIEDCSFNTGDDCIAIKSGRNDDGRRVGVAAENIIIRNCTMVDGHGGVVIGSEISGGCRNVFAENCQMDSPKLNGILRFKNNAMRGGIIENIYMRNIEVGKVAQAALLIEYSYQEGANGPYQPVLRNVTMEKITGRDIPRMVRLGTIPGAIIENIRINDSTFAGPQPAEGQNTEAITFTNVKILPAGTALDAAPAAAATPPAPPPP